MKKELLQPHMQLAIMSREYVVSRAIHAIANLGIADHMSDKPRSVHELAQLTSTVPELLDRVLTFLTVYGLFTKNGDSYALTPLSAPLRHDHPFSMKDVLSMVDESWWQAFAHLETGLKTGTPAFNHQHGTDFFNFLNNNPEKKMRFQKGISKLSTYDDKAIAQGFNFGTYKSLIDIGAGQVGLTKAIATQYPSVAVTLFNLMIPMNDDSIDDHFATLTSAEAYLFKGFLHDFEDIKVKNILKNCWKHMPSNSSLIIAEQVIPPNNVPHTNRTMDIIMMVLVGGRQRTLDNWCELVETTGFKLKSTSPTQGIYTIMEFLRVDAK
jgi:C-methyltransferase